MTHWDLEAAGRAANALSMNAYRTVAGDLEVKPQGWKRGFTIDPLEEGVRLPEGFGRWMTTDVIRFLDQYDLELISKAVETT